MTSVIGLLAHRFDLVPTEPLREARDLFPNFPDEIFTLWLDGRVRRNGWPPKTPTWRLALRKRSIRYWQSVRWEERKLALDSLDFARPAQRIIDGLIEAYEHHRPTAYCVPDSQRRLRDVLAYIDTHRCLPSKVLLLHELHRYEIVDGSHRLAMYFALRARGWGHDQLLPEQEAWVACVPRPGA